MRATFIPRGLTRRDLLRLGIGALATVPAGGLAGCAGATPLHVAVQPFCGYQFLSLAQEQGDLRGEGVQLLPVATYADAVSSLRRGEADAAPMTLDQVLALRELGLALIVVMVFDMSAGGDVALARPGIETPAQLRGQRIGVEATSLGTILLAKLLEAGGLTRADVTVVPMEDDHFAAWNRGDLDALLTYEPALSQLRRRGLVPIFDSRALPQTIVDVLAVDEYAARRHEDALRALIAAHFRVLGRWRSNPIDTAYRLAGYFGVDADHVPAVINGLDLPDAVYNRHYLADPAPELHRSASDLGDILLRAGLLKRPPMLDGLFVPDYLPVGDA